MRIQPTTTLKRPRFKYNLIVNGKNILVNGKQVVVYGVQQNINSVWRSTWRDTELTWENIPEDITWENIPEDITWENINYRWDELLQKNVWKRPRFTYNLVVNWKQLVVNSKNVVVYWKEQNVNTKWR